MKIHFDFQIFVYQQYGGISRYFAELSSALEQLNNEVHVIGKFGHNYFLDTKHLDKLPRFPGSVRGLLHINSLIARREISQKKLPFLHATYYHPYLLERDKAHKLPLVVTVHDLAPFRLNINPKDPFFIYAKQYLQQCDAIICVSEFTQAELIDIFPFTKNKSISVVHHGVRMPTHNQFQNRKSLTRNRVIYVGNRQGYKNFSILLHALKLVTDTDLILIGGGPLTKTESAALAGLQTRNNRVIAEDASDHNLWQHYYNAHALVTTSKYEGFGMPVVEALAAGLPVIASDIPAHREIGGQNLHYFNPNNSDELAQLVQRAANLSLLPAVVDEIHGNFTWQRCAEKTLQCYSSL